LVGAAAWAQPAANPALPPSDADEAIEAYLADHQLLHVLAAHLRQRLTEGAQEDRVRAAEALGRLYVKMLSDVRDAAERQQIEARSQELLKAVPEAESYELRINLAKATYVQVEEMVERERLKLSGAGERAEAERILRSVTPVFEEIAARLHRRVEQLEKRETIAKQEDVEGLRVELGELRRLRSLARYYAGWSSYYTALLTGQPRLAHKALEDFGYILNAVPGRPASIERLPRELLRYEHVARAAVGCALATSMLSNHVEAQRWLDAVQSAEEIPQAVADQMFPRRLVVGAAGQSWADVELAVRRRRQPDPGDPVKPLSVAEARLLAILALDALRNPELRPGLKAVAERAGQIALGDLVGAGEIGHVLDLVRIYGTAPIGDQGFIVAYVRGLQAFEKAREAHRKGPAPEEPTADPALQNLYHEAADLLAAAAASPDAGTFKGERGRALLREGLSLFYAGDLASAAERFEQAGKDSADATLRRDALWYAIVALDRAVEAGQRSRVDVRDRLATLYLQDFPGTENAAKLLLRQTRADTLSDAKAIEILLAVPADAALYEASRRQAARLLYGAFKRAPSTERDFAALRFADVGEQVLRMEQARAMSSRDQSGKENAEAAVLRVRQLADALLACSAPDVPRVESALQSLAAVEAFHGLDLSSLQPEMEYRRLQIAIARGDEAAVRSHADRLRDIGGSFSSNADRLLYRRAVTRWKQAPSDVTLAKDVVAFGQRVLDDVEAASAARDEPAIAALRDAVADAASAVFESTNEPHLRELAIRLDRRQIEAGQRTASSLRRLAVLLESAGDSAGSLAMWSELLVGRQPGSDAWLEARYHSLRLMTALSPTEAGAAMQQFKALYPDLGPESWRSRFAELELRIREMVPAPAAPPPPGNGGGR